MAIKLVMWPSGKLLMFPNDHPTHAGKFKAYNQDGSEPPPLECCCPCGACPCCDDASCPELSADMDCWIIGVTGGNADCGCGDCANFATRRRFGHLGDCIFGVGEPTFWECGASLEVGIVQESGQCIFRAIMYGDTTNSSGNCGLWTAKWELNLGTGPIDCNDIFELPFVSQTPDFVPCDFSGSTFFAEFVHT